MAIVNRRATYKLYPSRLQAAELERLCDLHRTLYNAALQERSDAWSKNKLRIGFAAQCKSVTQIRRAHPEYLAVNAQSLQVTLRRLDLAFCAFFRRVKAGQDPGYPRFRSRDRFAGFGFKTHGDGFRFTPGANWRHGALRLSGVGTMPARGAARTPGRVAGCDIQRKADGWYLSLVIECQPHREQTGAAACGMDWGVETFATLAYGPGEFEAIPNDRFFNAEKDALKEEQRAFSAAHRNKRSLRAARARRLMAKRWRKIANRRKDFLHQTTARLVRDHRLIVTEKLNVKPMTAGARGTVKDPGRMVRQKAGLNRAILDTAPSTLIQMLTYKAEEAGCEVMMINPRKHKPSQRDPYCLEVVKKPLAQRTHILPNGQVIGRDEALALVMLRIGLTLLGREPSWGSNLETPSIAA